MLSNLSHRVCTILLALFIITPFSAQAQKDSLIWSQDEQFVRLVGQELTASKNKRSVPAGIKLIPNEHPITVPTETLLGALQHLLVEDLQTSRFLIAGKRQVVSAPLLGHTDSQRFAKALHKAFKQAKPNEDILFRIHGGKQTLSGFLTTTTINTGRAFWLNGKLNIIFGIVNERHSEKWVYGHKLPDKKIRSFGSRRQSAENLTVRFSPLSGIEQALDRNGKTRFDWLVIAPNQLQTIAQEQHNATSLERAATDTTSSSYNKKTASTVSSSTSVSERLTELKELYDSGLISQSLYDLKTKEIIDAHY